MRRASILVALFATIYTPALAQNRNVEREPGAPVSATVERSRAGDRDTVLPIVLAEPVAATRRTRGLVARSQQRIDFTIPWQTGIYQ